MKLKSDSYSRLYILFSPISWDVKVKRYTEEDLNKSLNLTTDMSFPNEPLLEDDMFSLILLNE